jgi:hypothetical protein
MIYGILSICGTYVNIDNNTKDFLLGVLGSKEGSLPLRYLGVPDYLLSVQN